MSLTKKTWGDCQSSAPIIFYRNDRDYFDSTMDSCGEPWSVAVKSITGLKWSDLSERFSSLVAENIAGFDRSLIDRVSSLEREVEGLRAKIQDAEVEKAVEFGDFSLEEAKKIIAKYFRDNDGEEIDYGDLMEALHIPLSLIIDACDSLEKEGKIAGVN